MTDATTFPAEPRKRPTFLTVLCILSFVGCAWGFYQGAKSLFGGADAEALAEAQSKVEEAKAQMGDDAASGFAGDMMDAAMDVAQKAAENAKPMGMAGILLAVIEALGVWLMWNLRKIGFGLYVLSIVGELAVPLIFLGTNMVSLLTVGFSGLFGVLFIILYGVNLKHMR